MSAGQIAGPKAMLEVITGARGWMTISPKTMSRRNPIDKHIGHFGE